jgi:hypothetical protein
MENLYSKLLKQIKTEVIARVIQGGELKSKRSFLIQNITSSDDRKDIADAILPLNKSRLATLSFVKHLKI